MVYFFIGLLSAVLLILITAAALIRTMNSELNQSNEKLIKVLSICYGFIGLLFLTIYGFDIYTVVTGDSIAEKHQLMYRMSGSHAWVFYWSIIGNCIGPAMLLIPTFRKNIFSLWLIILISLSYLIFEVYNSLMINGPV